MLHSEVPEMDTKGLREFGFMLGGILIVLFGMFLPWMWAWDNFPNLQWIGLGVVVVVWALTAPDSMNVLYVNWMRVAMLIGNVVNGFILAIVFYIVITPMGVFMRLAGKDPMCRSWDKNVESYRVISSVPDKKHVERPY